MKFFSSWNAAVRGVLCAAMGFALSVPAQAALTDEELKQLGMTGTPLTPVGAIRAGNEAGTIPEWVPKMLQAPPGAEPGTWPDPFADDKPLFTITAENYTEYQEHLTPGQIAMFKQYPQTFRMHVYPSRRSTVYEPFVYEATLRQAKKIKLGPKEYENTLIDEVPGGGLPFPIPNDGQEAEWNHLYNFRAPYQMFHANGALIDARGNRVNVLYQQAQLWPWYLKSEQWPQNPWFTAFGPVQFCDSWNIQQPPRSAGLVFGGCNYIRNYNFQAYLYIPGQRRVRKAPEIGFHDSPSFGSDGQRTVASRYMSYFGGSESRHDRKLAGRKELFVPYNNYQLLREDVTFDDIFGPNHINQDLIRYELHRVWVVDATLRSGHRHLYKRHTVYLDEDSWEGVAFEAYDANDRLWRVGEQYNVFFYGDRNNGGNWFGPAGDTQIDLINGRYTTYPYWFVQAGKITGFGPPRFAVDKLPAGYDTDIFTPQGLRKFSVR